LTQRAARCCIVFAAVLFCSTISAQTNFNYSITCTPTTLGPITVDGGGSGFSTSSGSITLTPNVPATGVSILTFGGSRVVNNTTVTSGTFTGTLPCALTLGGVTVNYSVPLSMKIVPSGDMSTGCTFVGSAFGCLSEGPVSVSVNLGAQGTVVISAPGRITLGYDQNTTVIVVPGSSLDSALLTPVAPAATPLPPSFGLVLTGLIGAGLYQARRKLLYPR
jgi:hypothetical protein